MKTIGVHEFPAELLCQQFSDRCLARSGHTHYDDDHNTLLMGNQFRYSQLAKVIMAWPVTGVMNLSLSMPARSRRNPIIFV
jgi:hypothetical protein